jgi:hypothetical protein
VVPALEFQDRGHWGLLEPREIFESNEQLAAVEQHPKATL